MGRKNPTYVLAVTILFGAVALALAATPPQRVAIASTTPVPAAPFRYSTVGSCGCELQTFATATPAHTLIGD